jgi:hypothetical protein
LLANPPTVTTTLPVAAPPGTFTVMLVAPQVPGVVPRTKRKLLRISPRRGRDLVYKLEPARPTSGPGTDSLRQRAAGERRRTGLYELRQHTHQQVARTGGYR